MYTFFYNLKQISNSEAKETLVVNSENDKFKRNKTYRMIVLNMFSLCIRAPDQPNHIISALLNLMFVAVCVLNPSIRSAVHYSSRFFFFPFVILSVLLALNVVVIFPPAPVGF